ncbi:MAG: DUF6497 family protein [Paracoccaceae bacterium]
MRLYYALAISTAVACPAWAETVKVPSGIEVTLQEVLQDTMMEDLWLRFRYVAPRIGKDAGSVTYDVALLDIDWLCEQQAVPYIQHYELDPHRVVVSMADRELEFGTSDPDATQFFGAYRLEKDRCIWEEF